MIRLKSQPTKNLKFELALNQRLTDILRNLTCRYLLLVDLVENVIHLVIYIYISEENGSLVDGDKALKTKK